MNRLLRGPRPAPLALLPAVLLLGCGAADDRRPVFPVTGQVLVNHKPAPGAVVSFHPAAELDNPRALRSLTTADAGGAFQLTTYLTHDGAPAGEYVVTVYWPGPVPPGSPLGEAGPDRLKGRYANPKTSPLRVTVEAGPNEPLVLALTGP